MRSRVGALRAFFIAIVGAEYILRWLPKDTHDWRRFLRPNELRPMIARHGLVPRDLKGLTYNPLTAGWRLSRNSSVNFMMTATKQKK